MDLEDRDQDERVQLNVTIPRGLKAQVMYQAELEGLDVKVFVANALVAYLRGRVTIADATQGMRRGY